LYWRIFKNDMYGFHNSNIREILVPPQVLRLWGHNLSSNN